MTLSLVFRRVRPRPLAHMRSAPPQSPSGSAPGPHTGVLSSSWPRQLSLYSPKAVGPKRTLHNFLLGPGSCPGSCPGSYPVRLGSQGWGWVSPIRSYAQETPKSEGRSGPSSLADQIMSAKKASDAKKGEPEPPKGPQPLSPWQKRGYIILAFTLLGYAVGLAIYFATPERDENGNVIEDEFSSLPFPSQHYRRLKSRFFKTKKDLEEPFSDKLLPDPLPEPYYQPKYTILLELTGLLVHSNWTHKHGWRFQKRPGVDMFLSQIGYPHFEVVVYTTENAMTFYPIVDGLDPNNQFIMYRLFRDATRYVNGHHTKDLKALNRDLKKVILVDWNKDTVSLGPDNALILPKWEGDNADRSLIGLAQLLQAIRTSDVEDVREVLEYYKQFENPIEAFRENQRKLQTEMEADEERKKETQTKRSSFFSLSGFGRSRATN